MAFDTEVKQVEFQPNDVLFHEGELSFHFFIVQSGQVEISKQGEAGAKIPLAIVGSGAAIGEFAMIDRSPRSATARAISPVTAAMISETAYLALIDELPDWAMSVMKAMVDRLRQTNEIIRAHKIIDEKTRLEIESVEFQAKK